VKRALLALAFSLLATILSAESSYLVGLLVKNLESSGTAEAARIDLESARLAAALEDASWAPRLAVDSPRLASYTRTGSENVIPIDSTMTAEN